MGRSPKPYCPALGLTPNTYYAGYVTFEVPADAAEELVLVYAPNFLETTYEFELH